MADPWRPRPRDLVIGGIPWIARMADKARARAGGTIGDYIYPCPLDKRVLGEIGMSADEFLNVATSVPGDADLVAQVRAALRRQR
ncbi:MAG: DUF5069 domain-containing protein [Actinobacteria bacterium]|nr:DUF5069 domain-containing protein [Actinomycetota bacterium]